MTNIKLIVADLDNTLLRRDKTISEYTADVFRRARERGVLTAFATGRTLNMTAEYTARIQVDGLVSDNGAVVVMSGNILREYTLPVDLSRALLTELAEHWNMEKIGAKNRTTVLSTKPDPAQTYCDFNIPLDDEFQHVWFRTDDEGFSKYIAGKYPMLSVHRVTGTNLYDVNPPNATKANGVRLIAGHLGITTLDTAAFGDDWNDVEMLTHCGVGVAMANAIDECKAAADYICGDCDADGAAKWIEDNLLP
jgi:Cof subfamily protein (haloacid dehalogenase superfamily)